MRITREDIYNLPDEEFDSLCEYLEEAKRERDVVPLIDNLETTWEKLQKKGCVISWGGTILSFDELDFNW